MKKPVCFSSTLIYDQLFLLAYPTSLPGLLRHDYKLNLCTYYVYIIPSTIKNPISDFFGYSTKGPTSSPGHFFSFRYVKTGTYRKEKKCPGDEVAKGPQKIYLFYI